MAATNVQMFAQNFRDKIGVRTFDFISYCCFDAEDPYLEQKSIDFRFKIIVCLRSCNMLVNILKSIFHEPISGYYYDYSSALEIRQ